MPDKIEKIAFFDFDDTICRGDSILPYLLYCIKRGYAPWTQLFRAVWGYLGWRINPQKARRAKTLTLSFIRGRAVAEMDALGLDFLRQYVAKRCFPEARAELERLKAQGYRIVVVTASPSVYMRMLTKVLPVDDVIATPCLYHPHHLTYDGDIGENVKGAEKVRLIHVRFGYIEVPFPPLPDGRAYGDSLSDAPMLELVGHPTLVNPKKALIERVPNAERVSWHL